MITRLFALLLLLPVLAAAQDNDLRLPISLDADSTNYDGKSSMLVFHGLRLSQGSIGIEADEGRATKLDFQDSVWRFKGNVVIDVDNGHIECESADLKFADHKLMVATIHGEPATFEMRHPDREELTRGEAERLVYDLGTRVIEFSGNAKFSESGNQIASSFIAYDIDAERINAESSGDGDDRVTITFTPQDSNVEAAPADAAPDGNAEIENP